jgi:hypothetical protein
MFPARSSFCIALLCLMPLLSKAQIVINELSNRNASQIIDEDADYEDWIEIYNAGLLPVNLFNCGLSDTLATPLQWTLPNVELAGGQHLLVFASGKDRKPDSDIDHWETVAGDGTLWSYRVPNALTPADWYTVGFDASSWATGEASIGYGDGDDATIVPDYTTSVFLRYAFDIDDTSRVADAFLHMDFDDGFVAYLNGVIIAEYGFPGGTPAYDALSALDHEAIMYGGGYPEAWALDEAYLKTILVEGENVIAVEVHNVSAGSSDLTIQPFLTLGFKDEAVTFADPPAWFTAGIFASNLHTNFKISSAGETIYLSAPDGTFLDSLHIGATFYNQSFGRETDGSDITGILTTATPGYSNDGSAIYSGYTDTPVFSLAPGFYSGSQETDITCPNPEDDIYYTVDGNTPTTDDFLYTGTLDIDATTTLRAACFSSDAGLLPGRVATQTYFIDEETELAVLSITTDEENLYGWNGIIDNWWTDWKKPCYFEFFDTSHAPILSQYSGIKVDGGAGGSRSLPQTSFRIEPDNDAFGDGLVEYPLIPRHPERDTYETFYLRNGSNMWNVLPYKDAFMVRTTEGTEVEHVAYTPVEVWLNGEYWGLYELREKLDEGHFQYTHLIDKEDQDLLSMSYWYGLVLRTLQGSDEEWHEMIDYLYNYPTPTDTNFWDVADSILDLTHFTDYIIAETWLGNTDWPWNNIKIYRDHGGDNKWKYALIDVEWGLGYGWTNEASDLISYVKNDYNYYTSPIITLLENEKYRNYFINRYADLMNTTYLPERTLAMEDSIYNVIVEVLPRQLERWGGGDIPGEMAVFEDYRNTLLDDFEVRSLYVRNHIRTNFDLAEKVDIELNVEPPGAGRIHINTIKITDTPWEGVYFDGVPVTITAEPFTGYTFSNWDESEYIADVLAARFTVNVDDDASFTAYFTGSPQPEEIVISEINYNSEASVDAGDWLEIWNHGDYPVDLSGWWVQDGEPLHQYILPEDLVLAPNQRWVLASDPVLFAAQHPDITQVSGPLGFNLSNNSDFIKVYNERNELVIDFAYSDEFPWPYGPDGEGRTLELVSPDLLPGYGGNWFDGCIGGSPAFPYSACAGDLVISEINYQSDPLLDSDDWIELYNISNTDIDLSGWTFMNSTSSELEAFEFAPATIIEAGERLVLAQTDWMFAGIHDTVENYVGSFFFGLDGSDDWLRLYDADSILRISVHYLSMSPWPVEADGNGYTLELIDSIGVMNNFGNWMSGCYGGSPGVRINTPCEEPVNIPSSGTGIFSLQPNPARDFTTVYLPGFSGSALMELVDLSGKVLFSSTWESNYEVQIDLSNIPQGVYLVKVYTAEAVFTERLIRQ